MPYQFLDSNSQFSKSFNAISESDFYKGLTPELGYQHKIGHIQKVMLFSQIIALSENLDERQMRILLASAAFHDSGRTKDRDNGEHGVLSAEIAGNYFKENSINPYGITQDEIGIVQVAIAYHVINDTIPGEVDEKIMLKLCRDYGVDETEDLEKIKQVSAIIKDADALDRARFSSKLSSRNSLDPKLLRTETAKKNSIMEFAMKINQAYAGYILRENYPNEPIEQGDNAKTLQFLRYDYKVKNGGVRKVEKDVPVRFVISMLSEFLKSMIEKDKIEDNELEL